MSFVKMQHYLARKHMSWFCEDNGKASLWLVEDCKIKENLDPQKFGLQKNLYESEELEKNHVEKTILNPIEVEFFKVRENIISNRKVRKIEERTAIKRYIAAQYLRRGNFHKRISQMDKDLRFIAKEIGLETIWKTNRFPESEIRKSASAVMAHELMEIEQYVKMLDEHAITYVERKKNDLLLPDSGIIQYFIRTNKQFKMSGLASSDLMVVLPLAANCAVKLEIPSRKNRVRAREIMNEFEYEVFLQNLSLNAKLFVIGAKKVLVDAKFSGRPFFDPTVERLSMILQLYKSGSLDDLIHGFWKNRCSEIPEDVIREWFYEKKFRPAINKLFNPSNDPNVTSIPFAF